jgi:hypothetical protein
MCWTFAVVLYRTGTAGSVARKLALLLVVEGITLASSEYIAMTFDLLENFAVLYPRWERIGFIIHTAGDSAMLALYPPFLAVALQTKLTRPFAGKRMRIAAAVAAVVLFIVVQTSPMEVGAVLLYVSLSLLFGFALVASIHAWYVATAGTARNRARIFVLAFGFRDICWGMIYIGAIWRITTGAGGQDDDAMARLMYTIYALGTLLAIPLIAYGILRTQLFDIDLRIRWTIKQSTVAAVFVAIFYLVSEGADRMLSSELGNVAGLLATAMIVFFLVPLQQFAERVASVAMPNTQNTPEYAAFKKLQVYESALIEAQQYDGISDKERSLLNRLRDSLGITPTDATTMEHDLQTVS